MKKIIASILAASPLLALAQPLTDINTVALKATYIGNLIIGLAISIAVLWIIVQVVIYLIATTDMEKRKKAGWSILYGIIGLFVILSIWGLVAILRNTFRTADQEPTNDILRTRTLPAPGIVP